MRYFSFVLGLLAAVTARAADITGTVTDSKTSQPVNGALVMIKGTTVKSYTSSTGAYRLSTGSTGIRKGEYSQPAGTAFFSRVSLFNVRGMLVKKDIALKSAAGYLKAWPDGMYLLADDYGVRAKIIKTGNLCAVRQAINGQPDGSASRAKSAAGAVTIQAESMNLSGYKTDPGYDGVRDVIMVDPGLGTGASGTATKSFTGASGLYKIDLYTCPENDGSPSIKLYVGSKLIINEVLPSDPNYVRTTEKVYTAAGIQVNTGDEIKIEGTANAEAWARVDKLVFSDGMDVTLVVSHADYVTRELAARLGEPTNISLDPRPVVVPGSKPGPGNTGPTGTLKPYGGSYAITQPGIVLENVSFNGTVTIKANNVTIRNFKINAGGGHYGLNCNNGSTGLLLEDGEIYNFASAGILGSNFTARRLNVHESDGDGIKPYTNATVEGCWIHHLGKAVGAHADGVQFVRGGNSVFRGNNIDMPVDVAPPYKSNATFIISTNIGPISNILIEENWLNGGNYTFFVFDKGNGYGNPTGVRVRNNKIGRDYKYGVRSGVFAEWIGNTWEDSGAPCN